MIFSLVVMTGLENCCITSAYLQWLCHSGERPVARGPLVLPVLCTFFRQKLTTALLESEEGREWPQKIFHDQSPWKNVGDLGGGWTRDLLVSSRKVHPTEPPRPAFEVKILLIMFKCQFSILGYKVAFFTNFKMKMISWFYKSEDRLWNSCFCLCWGFTAQSPRKNVANLSEGWTHNLLVSSRTAHLTEPPRSAWNSCQFPTLVKNPLIWSFLISTELRFYGPVNPLGSCRVTSVSLTKLFLDRLSPPSS